jgi:5-methylcytosine-specific restriction endonuclease McrA
MNELELDALRASGRIPSEKLCPRCFFAEAKIDGDVGICPKCGPIRKVHYELKSTRSLKSVSGDYWRKVARSAPKPKSTDPRACLRCGADRGLERDHIKPRAEGGQDDDENLRDLCIGCHDYRHARDSILKNIEKFSDGNSAQLTMWIFRLGVLEMLNTPELVKERGYKGYWTMNETHYARWYEQIKTAAKSSMSQTLLQPESERVWPEC